MSLFEKANAAGMFQLTLDDTPSSAYIRSVDGGFVKASLVDEPIGTDLMRVKHTSLAEIEPFSFEIGFAGSKAVLQWIQDSWLKRFSRMSGEVHHAGANHRGFSSQFFTNALITETSFPTLDGGSREQPYLKFKALPEGVEYKKDTSPVGGKFETTQKEWSLNSFRLVIDGVKTTGVTKIEGFTVKQGVKKLYSGRQRFPELEPTKIDFPNIVAHIPEANAAAIFAWYEKFVVRGQPDPDAERSGAIEFLGPDKKSVLLRIELHEIGLISAGLIGSQANQQAIKICRFEMYVGRMELELGRGFS
jgi:hypothetical protein